MQTIDQLIVTNMRLKTHQHQGNRSLVISLCLMYLLYFLQMYFNFTITSRHFLMYIHLSTHPPPKKKKKSACLNASQWRFSLEWGSRSNCGNHWLDDQPQTFQLKNPPLGLTYDTLPSRHPPRSYTGIT